MKCPIPIQQCEARAFGDMKEVDGHRRFCGLCEKNVVDLSSMSAEKADAFRTREPGACVRYLFDSHGRVLHHARRSRGKRFLVVAAVASLGLVSEACGSMLPPPLDPAGQNDGAGSEAPAEGGSLGEEVADQGADPSP